MIELNQLIITKMAAFMHFELFSLNKTNKSRIRKKKHKANKEYQKKFRIKNLNFRISLLIKK